MKEPPTSSSGNFCFFPAIIHKNELIINHELQKLTSLHREELDIKTFNSISISRDGCGGIEERKDCSTIIYTKVKQCKHTFCNDVESQRPHICQNTDYQVQIYICLSFIRVFSSEFMYWVVQEFLVFSLISLF